MAPEQEKMISLMKEILQEDYLQLNIRNYTLHESLDEGTAKISCKITTDESNSRELVVEGSGVGVIDALFNGLRDRLADEHPSLRSITFSRFEIRGLESGEHKMDQTSEAEATVGITNSEDREFIFQETAPSISHAGVKATARAAEYFLNSERTFIKLHEILEHYRSEGRTDLVQKYTGLMSEVVKNTSYSEVVEQIRSSLPG